MDDTFNPDDYDAGRGPEHHRQQRLRDEELLVFRLVWERLKPADREEFKACLHALWLLHHRMGKMSGYLLGLPNITVDDLKDWPEEALDRKIPVLGAILKLGRPAYITDEEYLCAIACWEHDEPYVAAEPFLHNHPRWPFRTPLQRFDDADPAPG